MDNGDNLAGAVSRAWTEHRRRDAAAANPKRAQTLASEFVEMLAGAPGDPGGLVDLLPAELRGNLWMLTSVERGRQLLV